MTKHTQIHTLTMSLLGVCLPALDPHNLHPPRVHSECIFGSFITVLTMMIIVILLMLRFLCERGRATRVAVLEPGQKIFSVIVN